MQYFTQKDEKLVCLLCNHYCHLSPNQVGLCGVNKNSGNTIECLVYGHLAALNIDPVEKKPLYHFLPNTKTLSLGTIGCNFHCPFCQNWGISQEKHIDNRHYYSPSDIVQSALKYKCASISYTYNEPTIFYPYAKDIAVEAKKAGLKNIYVSNGYESHEVIMDMKGVIDACNIDLKSFNPNYYKQLGGKLDPILKNLKTLKSLGIWLEVTTLIVPTKNDSLQELNAIASFIRNELDENTPWHISAFHPEFKEQNLPKTSLALLQKAYAIGKEVGLNYVYVGNVSFDNITYCTQCHGALIKREQFNVVFNHLVQGKCPFCNKKPEGVFDEN
ncbi:MAG: AmmeMemoRadiSam system radical SAM enzyme [Arcobacteraceae bacterium]